MTEREQGKDTAFPTVVRAHDEREVFETDLEGQRPEDKGQGPEHAFGSLDRWQLSETGAQGIKWTGPDVAKDDAQCAHAQRDLCT